MKKTTFLGAIGALLIVAACGKKAEQAPAMGPMPFPVQTIAKQDAVIYDEYTANLEGEQNVEIRPKVSGYIQEVYVDEGQQVRKGQVLFKLETQVQNQDAAAAKANVNAAQVEVDRLKPLVDRKIISVVQLETAKAKLAQAKASYSAVAANINFGTITSPVDGVIGTLPFKAGSLASPTMEMPLTTVADTRVVRAYFSMNEKQMLNFTRIFKGATLQEKLKNTPPVSLILVDGSEYEIKGKITTVSGLVNAATGNSQFRADFKNPEAVLRSGSKGSVRLPIDYKDAILVPQNAVFDQQGKQMIYVVAKDNTVKAKVITTTTTSGLNYVVSEGLEVGDVVVVEGAPKLKDGMQIVPQDAGKKEDVPATAAATTTTATEKTTVTKK